MQNLTSNALIAQLSITMLGNRHKDATLTQDVHHRHSMAQDAGLYQKCLLPEACLAPLRKICNATRADHHTQTLTTPYGALLPAARVEPYLRSMERWQTSWNSAVRNFIDSYDHNVELARRRLNGSFRAQDYPDKAELQKHFTFDSKLFPLPSVGALDELAGLADSRVTQMRAQLLDTAREASQQARNELMTRLLDRLQSVGTMLCNPDAKIWPKTLENLTNLLDLAPAYNLTGDTTINRLVTDCRRTLTLAADALKDSTTTRSHSAAAAKLILQGHGRKIELPKKPVA